LQGVAESGGSGFDRRICDLVLYDPADRRDTRMVRRRAATHVALVRGGGWRLDGVADSLSPHRQPDVPRASQLCPRGGAGIFAGGHHGDSRLRGANFVRELRAGAADLALHPGLAQAPRTERAPVLKATVRRQNTAGRSPAVAPEPSRKKNSVLCLLVLL